MSVYCKNNLYTLYLGKMQDELDNLEDNSVDSIVTDPPYELNFMNKGWDNSGVAFQKDTWEKCLRVLKPGGHLLAFGGSRTYHRIACAIEDAGFEIRDTIMWLYGCLSEDTKVLTRTGFKYYNEISENDEIRIYDIKSGIYKWEKPERWNVYKTEQDTCFRIKSDFTDQLVSRNHRCLVERDGELVFDYAENLGSVERVPVLSFDIPYLQKVNGCVLFTDLLWQGEDLAERLLCEWEGEEKPEEGSNWGAKPILERWGNLSEKERELLLSENKVCALPGRVYVDGEKRWVCNGTQASCCKGTWETSIENRGCPSHKSQCRGQQVGESDVVCKQQGAQTLREWKTYTTTLATITKEDYTGVIFCPTVSTGCFVAERNGQVFITGNSGFPKSLNLEKAIEAKITTGSANKQEFKNLNGEKVARGNYGFSTMYYKQGARPADYNKIESDRLGELEATTEEAKKWKGWGSSLKPAYEPIVVARKPFNGSLVDNIIEYGVGGLNIDECRVPLENGYEFKETKRHERTCDVFSNDNCGFKSENNTTASASPDGRFPANIITDGSDEVAEGFPNTKSNGGSTTMPDFKDAGKKNSQNKVGYNDGETAERLESGYTSIADEGSAMRYFYVAKESNKDIDNITPNFEPIVVARKPTDGSLVDNIIEYGVGGLNIDECRVEAETDRRMCGNSEKSGETSFILGAREETYTNKGRFPSNVVLDGSEEVTSGFPVRETQNGSITKRYKMNNQVYGEYGYCNTWDAYQDSGSASRYYYCAKASKKDRDEGLDEFETKQCVGGGGGIGDYLNDVNSCSGKYGSEKAPHKNTHPTVKPTELMQYLVRLVSPKGATILDPFMGSGSTGKACMIENTERNANYKFIGIEMTEEYLPIADARIRYWVDREIEEEVKEDIKPTSKEDVVKLW